jgi:hypothetical protein
MPRHGKVGITLFCESEGMRHPIVREANAGDGAADWTATPALDHLLIYIVGDEGGPRSSCNTAGRWNEAVVL